MSVQTQIDRITDTVSDQTALIREIRTALEEKGGSGESGNEGAATPLENNTAKLQGILQTVRDLPEVTEVKLQEKSVTPGMTDQSVLPDAGYEGLSEVTVLGDSDLLPGNIKNGVRIFGVDGSYEGAELNFEVVGGTSVPASPKENTIWVNTNTAITDWVFSATQPSAKSGRVWISTGTSSPIEFNALKKNGIQVYPISAKQYVSGAWVDRTAKTYQGDKWENWDVILYDVAQGIENSDLLGTGGFSFVSRMNGTSFGTVNKTSDGISMNSGYDAEEIACSHTKIINLSNFSKLHAEWTGSGGGIGIYKTNKPTHMNEAIAFLGNPEEDGVAFSGITSGYIVMNAYIDTVTFKKIWLE